MAAARWIARRLVYDGLTQLDASGAVRPALALTWEPDNNNHRWQFRLRPGVHFHDGSSLTSAAVAASLTASCTADCPWTAVKAVGPLVVFTSDSPMPNLPALLAERSVSDRARPQRRMARQRQARSARGRSR